MMRRFYLPLFILMLALVACSPAESEPAAVDDAEPTAAATEPVATKASADDQAETAPTESDGVLIFRRSGGIRGINEQWTIYEDGRMIQSDGSELEIENNLAQALFNDVDDLGFYELETRYMPSDTCCDRFTYELTVQDEGKSHTVTTMDGATMPTELENILNKVNFVLFQE